MKQEKAERLLHEWQNRLGLQSWRIKLKANCTPEETEDNVGLTSWQEVNESAMICIEKEEYYGKRVVPFDFEKTLVHELLHLKLCYFEDVENEFQARYAHTLIDQLARAFVDAKRYEKNGSK